VVQGRAEVKRQLGEWVGLCELLINHTDHVFCGICRRALGSWAPKCRSEKSTYRVCLSLEGINPQHYEIGDDEEKLFCVKCGMNTVCIRE